MANTKYTQDKYGYFQTKVWDGTYNENGTKHRITLRSKKSSRDLERKANAMAEAVRNRSYIRQSDICVQEYARRWLGVYKTCREGNTWAMYQNIIERHLISLATVKVTDLMRIHVMLVLNEAHGKNRTQEQILMTMKQIVKSAISDKLLAAGIFDEIFSGVTVKKIRSEKRPLTDCEKKAVFLADLQPAHKAFLYLIYGCGLRRGEALALSRFDLNFRSQTVTVNKSLAFSGNDPYIKGTKNGKERTVPIPSKICRYLENYCQDIGRPQLFTTKGKPYITKSSYNKMWAAILSALKAAGADTDGLTAHVFRHNYCTNLCYQIPMISIKHIAALMGDTEKMVIEVYNHIILEKEDTVSAIEKALEM